MLDLAATPSASVHTFAGSSRPGAVPPLVPLGAVGTCQPACGHASDATSGHVDADVIDLAGRVKRLAERLTCSALAVSRLSQQVHDEHPSVMDIMGRSASEAEFKAHAAEVRAAEEQLGLPRLRKARRRMMTRLVRWTAQLVAVEPRSLGGLGAKVETISPVQEAQRGDLLADDIVEAVERDTVRLTGSPATAGADPALLALVDEFRRLRRAVRTMEVASKGRDIDEMPGWGETCARLDEIVGALYEMRAESAADLVIMARVVQTRWVQDHHQFAADLGFNFADDVLRLLGREAMSARAIHRDLILDLSRQAGAFRAAGNAAEDQAAADRALERETAVQERAIASPPRTVEGAIAALEWARADLLDYADQAPDEGDRFRVAMLDGTLGVLRGIAALPSTRPHPDAELLAVGPAWEASAARCDATTEVLDAAEDRRRLGEQGEAGFTAAQAADAEAGKENHALRRRIVAMPARTLDGILLKARVARWCFMDDEDEIARHLASEAKDSAAAGETMAFSILLDLARMVGAPAIKAPSAGIASNIRPVSLPTGLPARHLGTAAAEDVREWYRSWLYAELRMLNLELDGSPEISAIRQDNPGADFHFPAEMNWRDVPKPSTRAAAVLGMLGILPVLGIDGQAQAAASAA